MTKCKSHLPLELLFLLSKYQSRLDFCFLLKDVRVVSMHRWYPCQRDFIVKTVWEPSAAEAEFSSFSNKRHILLVAAALGKVAWTSRPFPCWSELILRPGLRHSVQSVEDAQGECIQIVLFVCSFMLWDQRVECWCDPQDRGRNEQTRSLLWLLVFWVVTPYGPPGIYQRFGGTHMLPSWDLTVHFC